MEPGVEREPEMEPKVDELALELEANLQGIDQSNSPYITKYLSFVIICGRKVGLYSKVTLILVPDAVVLV